MSIFLFLNILTPTCQIMFTLFPKFVIKFLILYCYWHYIFLNSQIFFAVVCQYPDSVFFSYASSNWLSWKSPCNSNLIRSFPADITLLTFFHLGYSYIFWVSEHVSFSQRGYHLYASLILQHHLTYHIKALKIPNKFLSVFASWHWPQSWQEIFPISLYLATNLGLVYSKCSINIFEWKSYMYFEE